MDKEGGREKKRKKQQKKKLLQYRSEPSEPKTR